MKDFNGSPDYPNMTREGSGEGLPTAAEELFALVRELTATILEFEWMWSVHRVASSAEYPAVMRRARALDALGEERGNEALEAGRQRFAEGFADGETREIFLHGTEHQWEIVVADCRRRHDEWLEREETKNTLNDETNG